MAAGESLRICSNDNSNFHCFSSVLVSHILESFNCLLLTLSQQPSSLGYRLSERRDLGRQSVSRALARGRPGSRSMSSLRGVRTVPAAAASRGVGPAIATTSQRDLGDTGPPEKKANQSTSGRSYLESRLSRRGDSSASSRRGLLGLSAGGMDSSRPAAYADSEADSLFDTVESARFAKPKRLVSQVTRPGEKRKKKQKTSKPASPADSARDAVDPAAVRTLCAKLKLKLEGCWKEVRREMKDSDVRRAGSLPARLFRSVLARYDIVLNEDDFYTVMHAFSRDAGGGERNVHYDSFLRTCLR